MEENVFLIDWLTFVSHCDTLDSIKSLLGLQSADIPWETSEKFRNGYPLQCSWNGITISYGADDERFYKDPGKVRHDMGICVNFSGTGCRTFESYGHGDWMRLLGELFTVSEFGYRERKGKRFSYNITRLDLAYDDHVGLLDIHRLRQDVEDRNYVSPAKYSEIVRSDNQMDDIIGLTIQVGSDKSDVKIRIYDKAAERGFKDRHWIRCEIQLRNDRSGAAGSELLKRGHVGQTCTGILRNYLTFRVPTDDTNKSRWPMADYWAKVLQDMERIRLWVSPGEQYNFSKTEHWLIHQYGQAIVVLDQLHDRDYLIDRCKEVYPIHSLSPRYRRHLAEIEPRHKPFDILDDGGSFDEKAIFGDDDLPDLFDYFGDSGEGC